MKTRQKYANLDATRPLMRSLTAKSVKLFLDYQINEAMREETENINSLLNLSSSVLKNIQSFFDAHAHHHAYRKRSDFYVPIAKEIQTQQFGKKMRILDLGCGDGNFIREIIKSGIDANFYGTDLSRSMILMSRELLSAASVDLIISDGLKIPFNSRAKFEVIHLDSVLHHLVSSNIKLSKELAREMIDKLSRHLSGNGILIVEEMFYNSYFFPGITSSEIFYLLKLTNYFHFDLSKFSKEIVPGLEVSFFEEKQLIDLLSEHGEVKTIRKSNNFVSKYKRLLLLKECGHISFILKMQ